MSKNNNNNEFLEIGVGILLDLIIISLFIIGYINVALYNDQQFVQYILQSFSAVSVIMSYVISSKYSTDIADTFIVTSLAVSIVLISLTLLNYPYLLQNSNFNEIIEVIISDILTLVGFVFGKRSRS